MNRIIYKIWPWLGLKILHMRANWVSRNPEAAQKYLNKNNPGWEEKKEKMMAYIDQLNEKVKKRITEHEQNISEKQFRDHSSN